MPPHLSEPLGVRGVNRAAEAESRLRMIPGRQSPEGVPLWGRSRLVGRQDLLNAVDTTHWNTRLLSAWRPGGFSASTHESLKDFRAIITYL